MGLRIKHIIKTPILIIIILALSLSCLILLKNGNFTPKNTCQMLESKLKSGQLIPSSDNNCDTTLHIAIVCGGLNSTRDFYVLLKSILFSRSQTIQLHLFVNDVSRYTIQELARTWPVPDLIIKFYNITLYEHEVSWITGQHYSHRYGLIKLVVPTILSREANLTKAILLDTDMLAIGDISQLWAEFYAMQSEGDTAIKPALGMVINKSDWYLGTHRLTRGRSVWPAVGRGFNSGMILLDLVELERRSWSQIWRYIAEYELESRLSTTLADQDIFNAIIKYNDGIVSELSCQYNIQLNDHADLGNECDKTNGFRLIHWNSPRKLATKNTKSDRYNNWYLTMRNWNGKLLQEGPCSPGKTPILKDSSDLATICAENNPKLYGSLRIYPYYFDFDYAPTGFDVTFVVHLSFDRLHVLDTLASHWAGPISVSIYLSELETDHLHTIVMNSENLVSRRNIGYHLVFQDFGHNYPINRMRNIALNNAITPYVFLSDIDFLPSLNLYEYLKESLQDDLLDDESSKRQVYVVPAFENLGYKFEFPKNKAELLKQTDLGSTSIFREHLWPAGHAPTDYRRWRAATKPYKVDWRLEYEPFIVASRDVPRFDERFVGFGWNKAQHIMLLAAMEYEFLVLPEAFVVHQMHSASYDIMKHRESAKYRNCIKHLKRTFGAELKRDYPNFFKSIWSTSSEVAPLG